MPTTIQIQSLCAILALFALPLMAWDSMQIDLPSGAKESLWRDALASNVNGRIEVKLASGRADVVTSNEVFEVDKPTKWKEGMGQALAYAQELNRKPVLAITSYSRGPDKLIKSSRDRFDLAETYCASNGVRLLILFPSRPELPHNRPPPPASPVRPAF
jgi:hypothetical protein